MSRKLERLLLFVSFGLAGYALWGLVAGSTPATEPAVDLLPLITSQSSVPAPDVVVEVAEPPAPPPRIDELPESVSAVLADNGNANFLERSDLALTLPPSVVSVLIDRGVVLRLAETSEPAQAQVAP